MISFLLGVGLLEYGAYGYGGIPLCVLVTGVLVIYLAILHEGDG